MSFLHPYFLLGLIGIGAPILIHLLTRDQVQRLPFPTLRFFAKGAKVTIRRKNFRELLLILMRVVLVALLALAFARPYLATQQKEAGAVEKARVVLVDLSGSMRGDGLAEAAKKSAVDAVTGADAVALLGFSQSAEMLAPFGSAPDALKAAAGKLEPGYGGTDLLGALRRANDLLRGVDAREKEIVLISDLARTGWTPADWRLDPGIQLSIQTLKTEQTKNPVAIVQADAPGSLILDGQLSSIAVRVANYSDQPREALEVTLSVNGEKIGSQNLNIPAGGSVPARFRHLFDNAGDHLGVVSIGAGEAFHFNARTLPRIPVLVINGRPSANPREDAAYFIAKALAPTENSPFGVQVVPADGVTPTQLSAASVVVLANVGKLAPAAATALAELLKRGGGLLFLPGAGILPETFNSLFAETAPCQLRRVLEARPSNGEAAESLGKIEYEHPIFSVFAAPHHGDLGLPKFARYWETTDTQRSRVLARFGDGRPAMLERKIANGTSLALVSAPDEAWNDLPYQSIFLPLLHQSLRHLAVQTGERTTYEIGETLPLPEGATLQRQDGQSATPLAPGFFNVVGADGKTLRTVALNAAFSEGNPGSIDPSEIVAAVENSGPAATVDGATKTESLRNPESRLWWYLLCGAALLSVVELLTANRTVRH